MTKTARIFPLYFLSIALFCKYFIEEGMHKISSQQSAYG